MRVLAGSLGSVPVVLAALHVYWAVGGVTGGSAVPSRPDGTPVFRPGPVASLAVALALTIAGGLVLARASVVPPVLPAPWIRGGVWAVAGGRSWRTFPAGGAPRLRRYNRTAHGCDVRC